MKEAGEAAYLRYKKGLRTEWSNTKYPILFGGGEKVEAQEW